MAATTTNINITNEQLAAIVSAAVTTALQALNEEPTGETPTKRDRAQEAAQKRRREHDAILDSKRVERMTRTAQDKLAKAGFDTKSSKQGAWVWVYPLNGQGRTEEFKSVKLPQGWKHSMKRGAFYRDFHQA